MGKRERKRETLERVFCSSADRMRGLANMLHDVSSVPNEHQAKWPAEAKNCSRGRRCDARGGGGKWSGVEQLKFRVRYLHIYLRSDGTSRCWSAGLEANCLTVSFRSSSHGLR